MTWPVALLLNVMYTRRDSNPWSVIAHDAPLWYAGYRDGKSGRIAVPIIYGKNPALEKTRMRSVGRPFEPIFIAYGDYLFAMEVYCTYKCV